LAEEGADIIAVDRCADFTTVGYPMATPADLRTEGDDRTGWMTEDVSRLGLTRKPVC
jgi:hypothetical protein